MALILNLRHLEKRDVHLEGEISAAELDVTAVDEVVELAGPVHYDLVAERLSQSVLLRGRLWWTLSCHCVRCLKPFSQNVDLDDWTLDLPLEGEEKVPVENDQLDLTPFVREDILLAFPQHPLCEPDCRGLADAGHNLNEPASVEEPGRGGSAAWAELNKLKF
jgi:uncharacterized metal-binding protein YceD (DUF177 family)